MNIEPIVMDYAPKTKIKKRIIEGKKGLVSLIAGAGTFLTSSYSMTLDLFTRPIPLLSGVQTQESNNWLSKILYDTEFKLYMDSYMDILIQSLIVGSSIYAGLKGFDYIRNKVSGDC